MIDSGTQSQTERRGSRDLCKTPITRSLFQVRLHNEMIDCAMSGTHFLEVCSLLKVRIFITQSQLPIRVFLEKKTINLAMEFKRFGILEVMLFSFLLVCFILFG